MPHDVFLTGGTGYIGRRLARELLSRAHRVRVLTRPGSLAKVPPGAEPVIGNALEAASFADVLNAGTTLVHLVGTPHPSPQKAAEFRRVDLPSIEASIAAGSAAGVAHLVYVSVAHPAPVMRAYIEARMAGEAAIARAGLTATVLRPWYVLGPGHRWPIVLTPLYAAMELLPGMRDGARRLGLVTIRQMAAALLYAVETPPLAATVRVLEVPDIRRVSRRQTASQEAVSV